MHNQAQCDSPFSFVTPHLLQQQNLENKKASDPKFGSEAFII